MRTCVVSSLNTPATPWPIAIIYSASNYLRHSQIGSYWCDCERRSVECNTRYILNRRSSKVVVAQSHRDNTVRIEMSIENLECVTGDALHRTCPIDSVSHSKRPASILIGQLISCEMYALAIGCTVMRCATFLVKVKIIKLCSISVDLYVADSADTHSSRGHCRRHRKRTSAAPLCTCSRTCRHFQYSNSVESAREHDISVWILPMHCAGKWMTF